MTKIRILLSASLLGNVFLAFSLLQARLMGVAKEKTKAENPRNAIETLGAALANREKPFDGKS